MRVATPDPVKVEAAANLADEVSMLATELAAALRRLSEAMDATAGPEWPEVALSADGLRGVAEGIDSVAMSFAVASGDLRQSIGLTGE